MINITKTSVSISSDNYSELKNKGIIISISDLLIAGIAIENGLTLITNNEKHFKTISGLVIENWKLD